MERLIAITKINECTVANSVRFNGRDNSGSHLSLADADTSNRHPYSLVGGEMVSAEISIFQEALAAKQAGQTSSYFQYLRDLYRLLAPDIESGLYDPRNIQWSLIMSPIEKECWIEIQQYRGRFWPQYPACGFFLDFADPINRIAIECDGSNWHDQVKDDKRDYILAEREGWAVWRLSGSDLWKDLEDDEQPDEREAIWLIKNLCEQSRGNFEVEE